MKRHAHFLIMAIAVLLAFGVVSIFEWDWYYEAAAVFGIVFAGYGLSLWHRNKYGR